MTEYESAPRWVGVDIGGSAIKLGALARDGKDRQERSLEIGGRTVAKLLDALAASIGALERAPHALGIGLPGLLDREAGCIRKSPNLPWLEGLAVGAELARRLGLAQDRVLLENDANVAALGERWLGAARDVRDALVITLPAITEQVRQGAIVPLAVTTGARDAALPEVPTLAETVAPGFDVESWQGLLVPKGVPAPIVAALHEAIAAALRIPAVEERLTGLGFAVVADGPADFARRTEESTQRFAGVIHAAGIRQAGG